jgi:hypothetical protein
MILPDLGAEPSTPYFMSDYDDIVKSIKSRLRRRHTRLAEEKAKMSINDTRAQRIDLDNRSILQNAANIVGKRNRRPDELLARARNN